MCIVVLGYLLGRIYFIQSDDYEMNYIAGGGLHGKPDEHLIFIKSIYGYITKNLYSVFHNVNWFGIGYLFVLVLCTYLILHVLKKQTKFIYAWFIAIAIEIIVLCWLTFTVIAYVCVLTAFLLLSQITGETNKKHKIIYGVIIALMFVCSWIFRQNAFVSGVILLMPLGWFMLKKSHKKYIFMICIIVLLGITFVEGVESFTYNDDMWKEYKEFNVCRSQMVDYPIATYDENKDMYAKLDLSKNDYECLTNWIFADKDVYSVEVLNSISSQMKIKEKYEINPVNIFKGMVAIKECWIFLAIATILIVLSKKNRKYQIVQGLFMFMVLGILFVIGRVITRVYVFPFVMGIVAIGYMKLKDISCTSWKKRKIGLILIAGGVIATLGLYLNSLNKYTNSIKQREEIYKPERQYIAYNKKQFFTVSRLVNIMPYKDISKTNEKEKMDNILSTGDWQIYNNTYWKKAQKYKFKYKNRLLIDIVDNNFRYLAYKNDGEKRLELIHNYLEEHTGKTIGVRVIKEFENTGDKLYEFYYE